MNQLNSKSKEVKSFITALDHCCTHIQQVRSLEDARELLFLLKQHSDKQLDAVAEVMNLAYDGFKVL